MNIISQVDYNDHNLNILDGILYYKQVASNVSKSNAFITTNRGVKKLSQTAIGCKSLMQYKSATTTWMPLKIPKYSKPVEVLELVVAREISDKPAFSW